MIYEYKTEFETESESDSESMIRMSLMNDWNVMIECESREGFFVKFFKTIEFHRVCVKNE